MHLRSRFRHSLHQLFGSHPLVSLLFLLFFDLFLRPFKVFYQFGHTGDLGVTLWHKLLDSFLVKKAVNHLIYMVFASLTSDLDFWNATEHPFFYTFKLAAQWAWLEFSIKSDAHVLSLIDPFNELVLYMLHAIVIPRKRIVKIWITSSLQLLLLFLFFPFLFNDLLPVYNALAWSNHECLISQSFLFSFSFLFSPFHLFLTLLLGFNQFPQSICLDSHLIVFWYLWVRAFCLLFLHFD